MSCQIDPMSMSCINIAHHQHISSLIVNSFIAYVGTESNFTIPFLEELLNLPQWYSSRRQTKLALQFMAAKKVTSPISQNSTLSWALPTSLCWFWHSLGHFREPNELTKMADKQVQQVAASEQGKGQNTQPRRIKPPFSGHKSLDWLSCMLKWHL